MPNGLAIVPARRGAVNRGRAAPQGVRRDSLIATALVLLAQTLALRRRKLLIFASLLFHLATFVGRQIHVALCALTQALLALAAVFVPLPAVAFQRLLLLRAE